MGTVDRPVGAGPIILRSLLAFAVALVTGAVAGVVVGVVYALTADPMDGWADLIAVLMGMLAAGLATVLAFWGLMVPVVRRFAPPGRRLAVLWITVAIVVGVPAVAAAALTSLPGVVGGEVNSGIMLVALAAGVLAPPAVLVLREGRAATPAVTAPG